jgi:hypothetical protein
MTVNSLGTIALHQGDFERAQQQYEEAIEMAREVGYTWAEGSAMTNLGSALLFQAKFGQSVAVLNDSLRLWRSRPKSH